MHGPLKERLVLCHGCWDLLHIGHIRHLQEARALGDRLLVSVTADEHVKKGLGRPHFNQNERVEALKALDCVDDAFVCQFGTGAEVIEAIRPAIYCKGIDYADQVATNPHTQAEIATLAAYGGEFHVTKAQKYSSSRLLNAQRLSSEAVEYLASVRNRGFLSEIQDAMAKADELVIGFVGERIIDEYRYVRALGKPSKEFILATVADHTEYYNGGVEAAAAQCEWRGAKVITAGSPLVKMRYVDADFNRKLFEVYSHTTTVQTTLVRQEFRDVLWDAVRTCDLVMVFDFGHGLLGAIERATLNEARCLAINVQTNAGNVGFNPVVKYAHADMVCIDEPEARFATRRQWEPMADVLGDLSRHFMGAKIMVTHGRQGAVVWDDLAKEITEIPAFASQNADTIGAGDAFLSAAAPLVAVGLAPEVAAFVGNVAGALKTQIVGHRRHVTRSELMVNVEALLS